MRIPLRGREEHENVRRAFFGNLWLCCLEILLSTNQRFIQLVGTRSAASGVWASSSKVALFLRESAAQKH